MCVTSSTLTPSFAKDAKKSCFYLFQDSVIDECTEYRKKALSFLSAFSSQSSTRFIVFFRATVLTRFPTLRHRHIVLTSDNYFMSEHLVQTSFPMCARMRKPAFHRTYVRMTLHECQNACFFIATDDQAILFCCFCKTVRLTAHRLLELKR